VYGFISVLVIDSFCNKRLTSQAPAAEFLTVNGGYAPGKGGLCFAEAAMRSLLCHCITSFQTGQAGI
jgi:hypothetical protein